MQRINRNESSVSYKKRGVTIKQKIIFLDIDGVLNGYNFWSLLGWKLACLSHSEYIKDWYRKISDPCGIHESKVKRLSKIIKKTDAKVVMSSTWRGMFWKVPYNEKTYNQKKLVDLLNKYNIEVIDITPKSSDGRRDKEILAWLSKHEDEVENFAILDDERFDLECFVDSNLVQTSSVSKGNIIKGNWKKNTGLKRKHVKKAIEILNGE